MVSCHGQLWDWYAFESTHNLSPSTQFFENRPNYNHKNKETEASGEATLKGIVHFNAFNINPSTKPSQ